ncbi:uncharacterized protein ACRADG_005258 [Cochliomyia hominivorax]
MKVSIFFLILGAILFASNTVQARNYILGKDVSDEKLFNFLNGKDDELSKRHQHYNNKHGSRHNHGSFKDDDLLKQNSIYRDNKHVTVRTHRDHKIFKNIEADRKSVVVQDDNGNVQEATQIRLTNRRG